MPTHAHYAGEFGARQQTSTLAKDPAYRGARAEHFARESLKAKEAHAAAHHAGQTADAASHALVAEHASQMASKHARAAEKIAPGSEHARYAREAADTAKSSVAAIAARSTAVAASDSFNQRTAHGTGPVAEQTRKFEASRKAAQQADAAFAKSQEATRVAQVATERARDSNLEPDHREAAVRHRFAERAAKESGRPDIASQHAKYAKTHENLTERARNSNFESHHREAAVRHRLAERAAKESGHPDVASQHAKYAKTHEDLAHNPYFDAKSAAAAYDSLNQRMANITHGTLASQHVKDTDTAYAKGRAASTPEEHTEAAAAHSKAIVSNRAAGDSGMVKLHHEQMEIHTALAEKENAKLNTAAIGRQLAGPVGRSNDEQLRASFGVKDTNKKTTKFDAAFDAVRQRANTKGQALSARAEQISALAKLAPSAAAHADASSAHDKAASEHRIAGNEGKAAAHTEKAQEHQKAAEMAMAGHTAEYKSAPRRR